MTSIKFYILILLIHSLTFASSAAKTPSKHPEYTKKSSILSGEPTITPKEGIGFETNFTLQIQIDESAKSSSITYEYKYKISTNTSPSYSIQIPFFVGENITKVENIQLPYGEDAANFQVIIYIYAKLENGTTDIQQVAAKVTKNAETTVESLITTKYSEITEIKEKVYYIGKLAQINEITSSQIYDLIEPIIDGESATTEINKILIKVCAIASDRMNFSVPNTETNLKMEKITNYLVDQISIKGTEYLDVDISSYIFSLIDNILTGINAENSKELLTNSTRYVRIKNNLLTMNMYNSNKKLNYSGSSSKVVNLEGFEIQGMRVKILNLKKTELKLQNSLFSLKLPEEVPVYNNAADTTPITDSTVEAYLTILSIYKPILIPDGFKYCTNPINIQINKVGDGNSLFMKDLNTSAELEFKLFNKLEGEGKCICSYLGEGGWLQEGLETGAVSNLSQVVCKTTHFTQFALISEIEGGASINQGGGDDDETYGYLTTMCILLFVLSFLILIYYGILFAKRRKDIQSQKALEAAIERENSMDQEASPRTMKASPAPINMCVSILKFHILTAPIMKNITLLMGDRISLLWIEIIGQAAIAGLFYSNGSNVDSKYYIYFLAGLATTLFMLPAHFTLLCLLTIKPDTSKNTRIAGYILLDGKLAIMGMNGTILTSGLYYSICY